MELDELADALAGDVVLPGDEAWDAARQAWNLAVDQRPVAVVYPESADDVVATVRFAAEHGAAHRVQRRRPQRGPDRLEPGHAAAEDRADGRRSRSTSRRAARASGPGSLSQPLAVAAGAHGLAYLAGTSPNVGVLGYALGGGLSWMIRTFGLACNSIVSADVVTADGRLVRADRETEPELFWALRGGGGNVGAVTAIELELFPIAEIYAGALFWPIERAAEILKAWRDVDRDRARRLRIARTHAPAAGRPVPARARSRPVVRPGRGGVHRQRERWRRAAAAAPRPRARDGHDRDDAGKPAERREHGSR